MASVPLDRPPETPFFDAAAWAACCGVGPAASVVASGETKPLGRFSVSATTWLDSVYVPQHAEKTTENLAAFGGVEGVLTKFQTSATLGITGTNEDLAARRAQFGENKLPEPAHESWWAIFFDCFKDIILIILLVAAVVALIVGVIEHGAATGWIDGVAILIAVFIVATVTATNDYNKQLQFRKLSKESSNMVEARVVRGGREMMVKTSAVAVGDLVLIDTGDKLPADGFLLRSTDLRINESSLTGESDEIRKSADRAPCLLAGTNVTAGTGAFIVTAVGVRTVQGQIIKDSTSDTEETPLQQKLDDLATKIGYIGMGAAVLTFIAMMVIKATNGGTSGGRSWGSWTVTSFIYAITIIVVAIPEGLPLAVTISLAYSTGKMLQDKNLIRHLDACETMGNATDICTDKTGTLTENQMTVVEAWLGGVSLTFASSAVPGSDKAPVLTAPSAVPAVLRDLLRDHLAINSTAAVIEVHAHGRTHEEVRGSKTEGAGLKLVAQLDSELSYTAIRAALSEHGRLIKQFAFSSDRKMMSTIAELPDGRVRVFTTGGSDMVLSRCTRMARLDAAGARLEPLALNESRVADIITRIITPMAQQSLRTIAVAYRDFPNRALVPPSVEEFPEQDLMLYGILGIKDPLRAGVVQAVATANRAGVRVRMVTGDNKITATAIARECGILSRPDDLVLEGPMFRTLTPAQLDQILPRLAVLARSSPKDKMILVRRLNGNLPHNEEKWKLDHPDGDWATQRDELLPGHFDEWKASRKSDKSSTLARGVVGVTGDGTNDAPALHASDVGLAMGIAGTEVAKESADIIITDDNFTSIINSIKWGRSVYDNVRCFLQFQLTVNVVALLLTFISACLQDDPPLNPVMMLWVNLIMDTMGALALATQAPSAELLERRPYSTSAFLVSPKMWRHIAVQSLFQLAVLLTLIKVFADAQGVDIEYLQLHGTYLSAGGPTHDDVIYYTNTFIFNTFVFCQIWNEFNARSLDDRWNVFRGMSKDYTFLAIIVISAGVQALMVEFAGSFVQCTGLSAKHWLYSLLISAITWPLGIVMRLIPVNDNEHDFAAFYSQAFNDKMARQLADAEAAGTPHPVFAQRNSAPGGVKVRPSLNLSASVHGLPLTASEVAAAAAAAAAAGAAGGAPPGLSSPPGIIAICVGDDDAAAGSGRGGATVHPAPDSAAAARGGMRGSSGGSAMDAVLSAPLSPLNDLAMISGLPTHSTSASPADAGFTSRYSRTSGAAGLPASVAEEEPAEALRPAGSLFSDDTEEGGSGRRITVAVTAAGAGGQASSDGDQQPLAEAGPTQ